MGLLTQETNNLELGAHLCHLVLAIGEFRCLWLCKDAGWAGSVMRPKDYRADIDGLRAIAVSAVVIYHAIPDLLPSGFVGVDIFFVISGYLIGGIIYSGIKNRTFTFADFYSRRAKRILPALIVVILAVLAAGLFLLDSKQFSELSNQSIAALLGISNIYFWEYTNYFDTASELQPLLMTWSLGVEEQFYVIFPFIVYAISRVPVKFRVSLLAGMTILSFVFLLFLARLDPISSFYLLPSRAWELSVGATLAIANREQAFSAISPLKRNLVAGLGMVLLAWSIFGFDHASAFPLYPIFISVVGTAMLMQVPQSWINRNLLSISAIVFVGLISYSWYLWHWPIMAYFRIVSDGVPSQFAMIAAVPISFVLGVLSWRFVEQPFRRPSKSSRQTLLLAGGGLGLALAFPLAGRLTDGFPQRLSETVLIAEQARMEGRGNCLLGFDPVELSTSKRCNPDGAKIALIGDSHASALGPGLEAYAKAKGTELLQHTKSSCGPYLGYSYSTVQNPAGLRTCGVFIQKAVARIVDDPDVETIIVAAYWPQNDSRIARELKEGGLGDQVDVPIAVRNGVTNLIFEAEKAGKLVVLVEDIPSFDIDTMSRTIGDGLPARHILRSLVAEDRTVGAPSDRLIRGLPMDLSTENTLKELAAKYANARYFNLRDQLCDGQACRYMQEGAPLYFDRHHLSAFGSRTIDWSDAFTEWSSSDDKISR